MISGWLNAIRHRADKNKLLLRWPQVKVQHLLSYPEQLISKYGHAFNSSEYFPRIPSLTLKFIRHTTNALADKMDSISLGNTAFAGADLPEALVSEIFERIQVDHNYFYCIRPSN